jgi:hypothetical protein
MNYATVDFRQRVASTKQNADQLAAIARQVVGERVLFGSLTHPNQLAVHFGQAVTVKGPRGRSWTEGTYVLSSVGSAWLVKSARQGKQVGDFHRAMRGEVPAVGGTGMTEEQVGQFLAEMGGATVQELTILPDHFGFRLNLLLSDGSVIVVIPTFTHLEVGTGEMDDLMVDPPDWELFTPYGMCLKVGPGFVWSYQPSDEADKD